MYSWMQSLDATAEHLWSFGDGRDIFNWKASITNHA